MTTAAMSVGPVLASRASGKVPEAPGKIQPKTRSGPVFAPVTLPMQAMVSLVIALLLESLAWWRGDFAAPECGMLLMLSTGLVVLGLLRPWFAALVPVAAIWAGVLMTAWATGLATGNAAGAGHLFAVSCLGFAVIHAAGGVLGLLKIGRRQSIRSLHGVRLWAWTASLPAVIYLVLMMLVDVPDWPFWLIGAVFASALFAVAVLVCRRALEPFSGVARQGLLTACGLGAIALGALATLDALWWAVPILRLPVGSIENFGLHPWLSLAWLMFAIGAMDQAIRLRQRIWAVGAGTLAALALIPLTHPGLIALTPGQPPILNMWMTTYGGAALLVSGLAARLLFAARANAITAVVYQRWAIGWGLVALGLGWFAVMLQIWIGFHPDGELGSVSAREWMTYAAVTALIGGGAAWATWRKPLFAIWRDTGLAMWIAAASIAAIGAFLIHNPGFGGTPVRGIVIFNTLWFLYGLPIGMCLGLRRVLGARKSLEGPGDTTRAWVSIQVSDAKLPSVLSVASLGLLIVWLGLAVRHGFHGSAAISVDGFGLSLTEWHTYALAFASLGGVFVWWNASRLSKNGWQDFGRWTWLAAAAWSVAGLLLTRNPLWTSTQVPGLPVFNALWFFVGVPILLCVAFLVVLIRLGEQEARIGLPTNSVWQKIVRGLGITSLVVLMSWVTLAVRQAFQGADLHLEHGIGSGEGYAYTMAWAVMGVGLLAAGIRTRSRTLRFASLAVMVVATGKVFLIDMAALGDLWRVLSFLGLGLTLLGLGFVYQRWVFAKPQKPAIDRD